LGQNFRKILTILIALVLIVSGLIITTMPVGAGAREVRGARQDPSNETNDFAPEVVVNTLSNPPAELGYENVGEVNVTVTVTDDDEERYNITNGMWYWNGTNISSVEIDLTSFGGANDTAMMYDADGSNTSGYDNQSGEGIWYYNLLIDGVAAGDYLIKFNATDNWGMVGNESFTLKISQANRDPGLRGGATTSYVVAEDQYSNMPMIINLTELLRCRKRTISEYGC
jgi:hypothetical protein